MPRLGVTPTLALVATLAGCDLLGPATATRSTIHVHHHAVECMAPWQLLCLLTRGVNDDELKAHDFDIDGFVYEWGYTYTLRIEQRRIPNPTLEGPSVSTKLRSVLAKERVADGTAFEIFLTADNHRVVEVGPDRYRFYGAAEFTCPEGAACDALRAQIAAGARVRYRFEHPSSPADALRLLEWEVCDQSLVGSYICSS